MNDKRIKIERILLIVAALVLCAFLAVRVTFAWLSSNTSKLTVVTGDADIDVNFYRLRDFNRDGTYDFNDYSNDRNSEWGVVNNNFENLTTALKDALGGGVTDITADNFATAYESLTDEQTMLFVYTPETEFDTIVDNVRMGTYVSYRIRVKNNSERDANVSLSFGNLMQYYYNNEQMNYYKSNSKIDEAIGGENGENIKNYAAKFLFSVVYVQTESDGTSTEITTPLWSAAQSEKVFAKKVSAASEGEANSTIDIDFKLAFDGKSIAADYLNYVTNPEGECYRECLGIAKGISGVTDPAKFTDEYIRAVYEQEMTYLFSTADGAGGGVVSDVTLKLDYLQITGQLIGKVME